MNRRFLHLGALLLLAVGAGLASAGPAPALRPARWAAPVAGVEVRNLYRVEPDLYRSAQPDPAGFRALSTLGVKTVLDLCGGEGDGADARGTSLRLLQVPMTAWWMTDDRVRRALRIVADPKNRPLLVHCHQGADRTGAILALYRVAAQGWTKEDALREMNEGGYHHSSLFRNLDRYVRNADIPLLRRELGLPGPALLLRGPSSLAASPAGPPF